MKVLYLPPRDVAHEIIKSIFPNPSQKVFILTLNMEVSWGLLIILAFKGMTFRISSTTCIGHKRGLDRKWHVKVKNINTVVHSGQYGYKIFQLCKNI